MPSPPSIWECVPQDFMKITYGAVVRDFACSFGLAVRGIDGQVLLASRSQHQGGYEPYLAELFAVREAISLAFSRSLLHVIIEGDYEMVILQLVCRTVEDSLGSSLVQECRQLLVSCSLCIIFKAISWITN
ncbi:unnamed protein product [Linum trigynum]|uniref:RNase H type-1 domain-containing protein n=1 Tax=Linum trigynum TaxID=586398 RepID=A0AAV2GUA2_9ROSI